MTNIIQKNNVQIVNWLLTRRCNLNCGYCGIVKNPTTKLYPAVNFYSKHEMPPEYVIERLKEFKKNFPDCFHIFYGGEPLLYEGLWEVIDFCNKNDIWYTIISNNTKKIEPLIDKLIKKVGRLQGFTASIDPVIYHGELELDKDCKLKGISGLKNLIRISDKVDDLVAEITIDNNNVKYVRKLVEELTKHNIWASITFVDDKKNDMYDFSNVDGESKFELVNDSQYLRNIFNDMIDDGLMVHMAEALVDRTLDILPSKFDCKLEKYVHNLTIDTNGDIRLCLRIRGNYSTNFKVHQYFDNFKIIHKNMVYDKIEYCKRCNWTCPIMSMLSVEENMSKDILHDNRG